MTFSLPKTVETVVANNVTRTAKDASKRIVSDLLQTAGGASDFTDDYDAHPTIVRRSEAFEDDTF